MSLEAKGKISKRSFPDTRSLWKTGWRQLPFVTNIKVLSPSATKNVCAELNVVPFGGLDKAWCVCCQSAIQ